MTADLSVLLGCSQEEVAALAAALEEADRQLAEVEREQDELRLSFHAHVERAEAAEAALKVVTDALESMWDQFNYGVGDGTGGLSALEEARDALAAIRQMVQP